MPSRPLVLSLDVGTSSARAILYDRMARAVPGGAAQVSYRMRVTTDGGVEGSADHLVAAVVAAIDQVSARAGAAGGPIVAVALSTFWHGLMAVGREGRALTPLYTWADTRSAGEAAKLRRRLDEAKVHARTGCLLRSSYAPAKLAWIRRTQPGVFRQARCWVSIGEYLLARVLGSMQISLSMASGTGLLDQRRLQWDREMLEAAGLGEDHLPQLEGSHVPVHGLRPAFARRWPALARIPWFPALGDGACSNIGAGATGPGRAAIMIGTSGAIRVMHPARPVRLARGLWAYRADRRRALVGGALSNGGNVVEWLQTTLGLAAIRRREQALAGRPPDGHGLTMLPLLAGERSPGWADHATGTLTGITLHTGPLDILQAGMEAVCYRFAVLEAMLARALPGRRRLIATGAGLLRSPVWMQIMADVLGKPLTASAEPEGSSRGAALMALEALGYLKALEAAPARLGRTFRPRRARHATYRQAIARQQALYHELIEP